jgi:hypothetical protein
LAIEADPSLAARQGAKVTKENRLPPFGRTPSKAVRNSEIDLLYYIDYICHYVDCLQLSAHAKGPKEKRKMVPVRRTSVCFI